MGMHSAALMRLVLLVILAMAASGCEVIGTIFKAGMITGVIAVVVVVIVVALVVSKLRR